VEIAKKEKFCSSDCQKKDWKAHKVFCGRSGELGFDFEIKKVEGKGFGVFAKRDFEQYEKVLIERPVYQLMHTQKKAEIVTFPYEDHLIAFEKMTSSEKAAYLKLLPHPNEKDKGLGVSRLNGINGDGAGQVFIFVSRINNNCNSNAFLVSFNETSSNEVLIANRKIAKDEEITIQYLDPIGYHSTAYRKLKLKELYLFDCNCQLCENTSAYEQIEKDLIKFGELVEINKVLSKKGQHAEAIEKAKTALELLNKIGISLSPQFLSEQMSNCVNAALDLRNQTKDRNNYERFQALAITYRKKKIRTLFEGIWRNVRNDKVLQEIGGGFGKSIKTIQFIIRFF